MHTWNRDPRSPATRSSGPSSPTPPREFDRARVIGATRPAPIHTRTAPDPPPADADPSVAVGPDTWTQRPRAPELSASIRQRPPEPDPPTPAPRRRRRRQGRRWACRQPPSPPGRGRRRWARAGRVADACLPVGIPERRPPVRAQSQLGHGRADPSVGPVHGARRGPRHDHRRRARRDRGPGAPRLTSPERCAIRGAPRSADMRGCAGTLEGMCRAVTCPTCGRPGWRGCGRHVEQVLGHVPPAERCRCGTAQPPDAAPRRSWLRRNRS